MLGQTLKSQAKKELSSPCIPIFKKFVTIKKNYINKKTYILIPMIPLHFIISKRNKQ